MDKNIIISAGSRNDRRELIIAAATKLFCQNGYSGTRMSDIAEEIKVTKPIVYRYFRSKEELFSVWVDSVLVERCEKIVDGIKENQNTVKETTLEILLRSADGMDSPILLAPWRIALLESDNFPKITQMVSEKFKVPIFNAVCELFEKGIKNGEIKETDSQVISKLFCAPIAAGVSMLAAFGNDYMTKDDIKDLFIIHHETFFKVWGM